MNQDEYDDLHPQTKQHFCEEHLVPKYQDARGVRTCPFCEVGD